MSPAAMRDAPLAGTESDGSHAKRKAAILSVLAATGVTALKLAAGLLSGSLGMLSEAAHSGIDLLAAGITLFSVCLAERPADAEHNYGHGKIESLSAFLELVLMLGSCAWLITESVRRILYQQHLNLQFAGLAFAVLVVSMGVDFARSRGLRRVAQEHRSDALAADAVHFATDIWASGAVIVGLAATFAGEKLGVRWLQYGDPVAALVVSAVILKACWVLGHSTINALLDAAPTVQTGSVPGQARSQLLCELEGIPGVLSVDRVRTRRSGSSFFADVTLGMERNMTFQRSEQLTVAATDAVRRHLPGADVVVHSVPYASLTESVHDRIRAVAARRNLAIHEISVQEFHAPEGLPSEKAAVASTQEPGFHVEQHLEVSEEMPLREAHELVTELESEMRREVPQISSILTHIESEKRTIERPSSPERDRDLELKLRDAAKGFPEIMDIHDVFVTRRDYDPAGFGHLQVACHCTLADDLPMSRVHQVITALEGAFKLKAPEADRLLIHPEPATDNRR